MANTTQTKKYLGGWDTSAYDKLSEASRAAYQTNWDTIKDKFNAVMEKSKRDQERAERAYSNFLADQASQNLRTQRAVDQDLINRGVVDSGARTSLINEQTTQTGARVNDALADLMGSTEATAQTSISGLGDLLGNANKLNKAQAGDQLSILQNKVADDLTGQQLAAEIAENDAVRAASASSGNAEDEEYNEFIRRMAVNKILNNQDPETGESLELTDQAKTYLLENVYNVKNAANVVKTANNRNITLNDNMAISAAEKDLTNLLYGSGIIRTQQEFYNEPKRLIELANANKTVSDLKNAYGLTPEEYYNMIYAKR